MSKPAQRSTFSPPSSSSSSRLETSPLLPQGSSSSPHASSALGTTPGEQAQDEPFSRPNDGRFWLPSVINSIAAALLPLKLENTGSVARDHLASERTFLAWLRTSLAFCSVGVALTQLFSLSSSLVTRPPPASDLLQSLSPAYAAGAGDDKDAERLFALMSELQQLYVQLLAREASVEMAGTGDARRVRRFAKPLGGGLIGVGLLILLIGLVRYFTVQSALLRDTFPATRLPILAVSALSGAFVIAVLAAVLIV